jgi:hypothetical protein
LAAVEVVLSTEELTRIEAAIPASAIARWGRWSSEIWDKAPTSTKLASE